MSARWTRSTLLVAGLALVAAGLAGTAAARVDCAGRSRRRRRSTSPSSTRRPAGSPPSGKRSSTASRPASPTRRARAAGTRSIRRTSTTPPIRRRRSTRSRARSARASRSSPAPARRASRSSSGRSQRRTTCSTSRAPRRADAITGLNRNTFRAGRQTLQDVLDAANIFPPKSTGKKIVVFAEDTAFGAGNVAAVQSVFGSKGHTVSKILSPFGAADLTPYAQQLKNSNADAAFVAWANTTNSAAMWQSLQQQGISKQMTIVTGLANRASYDALGPLVQGVTLISHYVYQAPHNAVNTYLVKWMAKNRHTVPDLFTPDGFVTAQMICRASRRAARTPRSRSRRSRAGSSSRRRASSGSARRITRCCSRCSRCSSYRRNGHFGVKVLKTVSAGNVQPPITPFK